MKKFMIAVIVTMIVISLIGCNKVTSSNNEEHLLLEEWHEILEKSNGTVVNFYGWGGNQMINDWIDNHFAVGLKNHYGITLNRVPMNIDEILNKLLGEKQLNASGTIDVVWINGENFYTAKINDLLYGPFNEKLPNFNKYIDGESIEVKYDFGFPVEGYETPYGKAQMVFIYDEAKMDSVPKDSKELMELVKKNPGKYTYPAPPDFTGSAFVRNIIYDIVGYEQFVTMEADKETIQKEIQPAIDYLLELKPYLWREGETYPSSISQLDNMYSDQEVLMSISYHPNHAASKILTGEFSETTNTFVFEKGTIGNTHFLAIPFNSPNKAGALAVLDYMLSVEMQASKYDPTNWGDLPVLDNSKLNGEEQKIFNSVTIGKGALQQDVLLNHRVPEMPANFIPIIEEIWMESILKK